MIEITNDVLAERMEGLRELFESKFEENSKEHMKIVEQTTKTNGNVQGLVLWKVRVHLGFTILGLAVAMIIIPVVVKWIELKILK